MTPLERNIVIAQAYAYRIQNEAQLKEVKKALSIENNIVPELSEDQVMELDKENEAKIVALSAERNSASGSGQEILNLMNRESEIYALRNLNNKTNFASDIEQQVFDMINDLN